MIHPVLIILASNPVAKGRPKFSSRGKFTVAYTPTKTRNYEDLLAQQAKVVMNGREVITEPLELSLEVFVAIPKSYSKKKTEQCRLNLITPGKPDIDNYLKIILDSLNGIVYKDDAQVCKCTVSKRYDDYPRVEILIKES